MTSDPHDPTRSGPPLAGGSGACLSVNEVEALCLKAARGAGLPWGLAEETGFAAGWLAARGLDGAGAVLARLACPQPPCAVAAPGQWRAPEGRVLCPISLGTTLGDFAALPEVAMADAPLRAGPVGTPVLLLPFLAGVAATMGAALRLDWAGGWVTIAGNGNMTGDIAALARSGPALVTLSPGPDLADPATNMPALPVIDAKTLRGLGDLAARTMVPASSSSRADAGAGTDND